MKSENVKATKDHAKSDAFDFSPMGHGMTEMMTKCCTGGDSFADCLKMMEEMKKQCCAPNKDVAESEGKKK